MKHIVVFGAGKSSTYLIEYLAAQLVANNWRLTVLDADENAALEKTAGAANTFAAFVNVSNEESRRKWVAESDVVISLLPPALHMHVALDCLHFSKHLLTASYVDSSMKNLADEVKQKGLLFLCEMGLDPGIDHMSAMKIINELKQAGSSITSFHSHCGGLVAPASDDNPWRYKISWNPRNIVMAGKAGAIYRLNGHTIREQYESLFDPSRTVEIDKLGTYSWYPNRDSISYIDLYGLNKSATFIRTTLRHPDFCFGWKNVVDLKLTDEERIYQTDSMSLQRFFQLHMKKHGFSEWIEKQLTSRFMQSRVLLEKLEELMKVEGRLAEEKLVELQDFMMVDSSGNLRDINLEDVKTTAAATIVGQMQEANLALKQLFFLGMDDAETMINKGLCSAADILQFAIEKKLALGPEDRDMIVMLHEFEFTSENNSQKIRSSLIVEGEDAIHTAMAKTVGLPLGIAAKLLLQEKIPLVGLHIPICREIYEPVLKELEEHNIRFVETMTDTQ